MLTAFLVFGAARGLVSTSFESPRSADRHAVQPADAARDRAAAALASVASDPSTWLCAVRPGEANLVAQLYGHAGWSPLWVDDAGRRRTNRSALLQLLRDAADDGLEPDAYVCAALEGLLRQKEPRDGIDAAREDVALTAALLRYAHDLHFGRVDPASLGMHLPVQEHHDFVPLVLSAIHTGDAALLTATLRPAWPQYHALRNALQRYRALGTGERWRLPGTPLPVRPGDPFASAGLLAARLTAFGDLASTATPDPVALRYDGELIEAVRRFQHRHGLAADGVIGRRTVAALEVPVADRVRQIHLAMERLRWVPDPPDGRVIVVNIPMFRLWAYDDMKRGAPPSVEMNVIVGRALRTETPVFTARMDGVLFRPSWRVPQSIVRNEMAPRLERDPAYARRQALEISNAAGDVLEVNADTIAALRRGALRVRQLPGRQNALGLVKFEMANEHVVYLHATPESTLFARSRRDFSHGCIRVEDPVGLAEWVLADPEQWPASAVSAAMQGTKTRRVPVQPVFVVVFYATAGVSSRSGSVFFAEDVYGHDARLTRALVP